jgi:hypothetical protein
MDTGAECHMDTGAECHMDTGAECHMDTGVNAFARSRLCHLSSFSLDSFLCSLCLLAPALTGQSTSTATDKPLTFSLPAVPTDPRARRATNVGGHRHQPTSYLATSDISQHTNSHKT